jgi:hypothetical protein
MATDLKSLAIEAGARFRHGASHCPLHGGDNPNAFHLYDEERRWHCFTRCAEGENDGDAVGFYMRWKGVGYEEARREKMKRMSTFVDRRHWELSTDVNGWSGLGTSRGCGFLPRRERLISRVCVNFISFRTCNFSSR